MPKKAQKKASAAQKAADRAREAQQRRAAEDERAREEEERRSDEESDGAARESDHEEGATGGSHLHALTTCERVRTPYVSSTCKYGLRTIT